MSQGAIVNPHRAIPRFRLNNITPFTYRDGLTFLEEIESIKDHITNELLANIDEALSEAYAHSDAIVTEWTAKFDAIIAEQVESFSSLESALIDDVNAAIDDFNSSVAAFIDDVNARISVINEKSGPIGIQEVVLGDTPKLITIDPAFPVTHEIRYRIIQDSVGGRSVMFDPSQVRGTLIVDEAPNAETIVILQPQADGTFRVHSETSALERSASWHVDPSSLRKIFDTNSYEAFPSIARTDSGVLVVTWRTSEIHYNDGQGKWSRSTDGGETWTSPDRAIMPDGSFSSSVTAVESMGGERLAMLIMGTIANGRPAAISISEDGGRTWGASAPVTLAGDSWNYPSGLFYDKKTGHLYVSAYGGNGAIVARSGDGISWEQMGPVAPGTAEHWPYSEHIIRRLPNGLLASFVRYESNRTSPDYKIAISYSSDDGYFWTPPKFVLHGLSGLPMVTVMSNDRLLMTLRDMSSASSWAYAESSDNGNTWVVRKINAEWMMYGQFIETGNGKALLVGGGQVRGESGNSDIWLMDASLVVGDWPKNDTGWKPLPLNPGFVSFLAADYRVKDSVVYFRGYVNREDNSDFELGHKTFATLPNEARPSIETRGHAGAQPTAQGASGLTITVKPDGRMLVARSGDVGTSVLQLSAITPYPVD